MRDGVWIYRLVSVDMWLCISDATLPLKSFALPRVIALFVTTKQSFFEHFLEELDLSTSPCFDIVGEMTWSD